MVSFKNLVCLPVSDHFRLICTCILTTLIAFRSCGSQTLAGRSCQIGYCIRSVQIFELQPLTYMFPLPRDLHRFRTCVLQSGPGVMRCVQVTFVQKHGFNL